MNTRIALLCCLAAAGPSRAGELVWQTEMNFQLTLGPSSQAPDHYGEIADDFEAVALIDRVMADGMDAGCFNCPAPETLGVYVRFYEWTESGPGELQAERFLEADDPNFMYDHELPHDLDIRLENPFQATGRHFVSVQMVFGDAPGVYDSWFWWQANEGAPLLSPIYYRTSADGAWGPYPNDWNGDPVNSDVAISIFGKLPGDDPSDDPCGEWSLINTAAPPGSIRSVLTDIGVVAPDNVWAVGNFTEYLSQWRVTKTLALNWDGSRWNHVPTPSPTDCAECTHSSLIAIGIVAPDDIWAAGNANLRNGHWTSGTHIMVQHWDGSEWSLVDVPDLGGGSGDSIADIEVIGPDEIWFVGGDQPQPAPAPHPALTLLWNGSDFERVPVPIVNFDDGRRGGNPINGISAIAPDDIWIVGGTNINADGAEDLSQIHHWDGSEWTHVPGPTPGYYNALFCVEAVATDDVWAAGEYWDVDGIFPLVIHWDGSGWTQVEAPDIFFDMHAFAPDKIYAGSGGIYLWDGAVWSRVEDFSDALYPHIGGLDAVAECELWASGVETSFDRFPLTARQEPAGGCPGDFNGDDRANSLDVLAFLNAFAEKNPSADFDQDGQVTTLDVLAFLNAWAAGCD